MKSPKLLLLALFLTFFSGNSVAATYDIIVAVDGSGNYTKVQAAFNAVPNNSATRTVIFVKNGIYKEKLTLAATKKNVTLIGESRDNTILTFDDYQNKVGSANQSTLIEADDFIAENITFQNTIDSRLPQYSSGGQATALVINGDRAILYKCKITGFQDTHYLKANKRSYHKECVIDGTGDFILGKGISLFENCMIRNRDDSHITAQNQEVGKNKYGFVFKDCQIIVHPNESVSGGADLGRPWGPGARVVFLNCFEGPQIKPEGWSIWESKPTNHLTAYYAEYKCTGPGFKPASRLSWTHQLTDAEAALYTKDQIFKANTTTAVTLVGDWNPVIGSTPVNTPPTVSVSSPANNATFTAPASITITGNASDIDGSVASVQFYQGATLLDADNSAPYSFTWSNVAAGSYTITAKATDNEGAATTSSAVSITINPSGNTPPTVSVLSPANGATFSAPASISITVNAADTDGSVVSVQFYQGATLLGTDNSSPYSFSWSNIAAGTYSLTAKATDNTGATTTSLAVSITVTGTGENSTITIQENQIGFCSFDGTIDSNNAGFTGAGFVNTPNATAKGITWSVNVPTNGTYALVWRYADGKTINRIAQVMIDGVIVVPSLDFPVTGSWTVWVSTPGTNLTLAAGIRKIRLQSTTAEGLANIDNITITGASLVAVSCTGQQRAEAELEISENGLESELNLYPIPANDLVNINLSKELAKGAEIQLLDNAGRSLIKNKVQGISHTLDLRMMQSGIYLIKVSNANKNIVKRILRK